MLKNYQKGISHTNTNRTGKSYYAADVTHQEESTIALIIDLVLPPNKLTRVTVFYFRVMPWLKPEQQKKLQ